MTGSRFIRALVCAIFLAIVQGCAATSLPPPISISASTVRPIATAPYEINEEGWYIVEARINGRGPYRLIMDTGATITAIFEKARQPDIFYETGAPPKRILGVNGTRVAEPVFVGDISIGDAALRNHVGVVIPDWKGDTENQPDGLLGLDYLKQFITVVDPITKTVAFYHHDNPPTDIIAQLGRMPMSVSKFNQTTTGLYTIVMNINGRRIPTIFDLGANYTVMNYNAFRRLTSGIYIDKPGPIANTGTRIKGAFGDETIARALTTGPIRADRISWGERTLIIYNAAIFRELAVHTKPYGLFGADFLRDRQFVINFTENSLYISGPIIAAR